MNTKTCLSLLAFYLLYGTLLAQSPSDPDAAQHTKDVYSYLYSLKGSDGGILSGQHSMIWDCSDSYPHTSQHDQYIHNRMGKWPAVFGSDFGDFNASTCAQRYKVKDYALAHAEQGAIVTLSYHLVQPDLEECAGFGAMHIAGTSYGTSKIDQILQPGTALNLEHLRRLDEIAGYFKEFQDKDIVILWRPFHEMNGNWFWWSHQPRYKELWIQMWDRFTNYHGLDNLLWVFSVNHWNADATGNNLPDNYYPGDEYVDLLGVDVYKEYGANYDDYIHDKLTQLGGGKPLAITENGEMPMVSSLKNAQPNYVYWLTWHGFQSAADGNSDQLYDENYQHPLTITRDEIDIPEGTDPGNESGNVISVVSTSADDAEESSSGVMDLTSNDLDIRSGDICAVRFTLNVPQGATIDNASLELISKGTNSGSITITIEGQSIDNAATFGNGNGNLSGRSRTNTSVEWLPGSWTDGQTYASPDLASVVQEVVNRPDGLLITK